MKRIFYKCFFFLVMLDIAFALIYNFFLRDQWIEVVSSTGDNILDMHFIDVAQGDCELAVYNGTVILIDTGEDRKYEFVRSYLHAMDIKKIDYFIVSHPHVDHMGGADNVINDFEIGEIYMPYAWSEGAEMEKMLDAIDKNGYMIKVPYCGETIDLGGCKLEFIGPVKMYDDVNNMSLNVKIVHGENTILYMGDTEEEAEHDLIASGCDLDADLLKVGHHGSRTSSCEEFLKLVSPEYAVISCGVDNEYKHPHIETLQKLKNLDVKLYRTDAMGTVVAVSDGTDITITTKYEYPGLYVPNSVCYDDLEKEPGYAMCVFIPEKFLLRLEYMC